MPAHYRELVALVPPGARRVLEVGCGRGSVGAAIKRRIPGCWVAGIELDRARATEARRRLDVVISDPAGGLPFTEPFDAIVVTDALGHLDDPRQLLAGLLRHLGSEGLLVAVAPAARNLEALRRAFQATALARAEPSRSYTRAELRRLLAELGFELTSLRPLPDPAVDRPVLPLDGARAFARVGRVVVGQLSADELADFSADAFVLTALPSRPGVAPECSVVMAVEDEAQARACADGLRQHPPEASRQVIVVLCGSGAGGLGGLPPAVRVLAGHDAPSRAAARNLGARHARGRYLVFLDGGTHPEPGWLDALLATARPRPRTGAVGSKRVYSDGTVAQAGIAFGGRDLPLQAWPYPLYRHADPGAPHVSRSRRVSAVAGSGLLVPRGAFIDAGGFEERFRSWLADVDLSLALRARGLAIEYCPSSVIQQPPDGEEVADADDVSRLAASWEGRLLPDDEVICRADGTSFGEAYGLRGGRRSTTGSPPVLWSADFVGRSGYVEEARSFVLALHRAGIAVRANPLPTPPWAGALPAPLAAELERLVVSTPAEAFIHVVHTGPIYGIPVAFAGTAGWVDQVRFRRHPRALRNIGRTMFETDRIPASWVGPCNDMDEVWVPSTFNLETFARAGVAREKLVVVPGALPLPALDAMDPALAPLWSFSDFVFLSVFAWLWRKGWDLLLQAYLEEFRRDEPVMLLLHVTPTYGSVAGHRREMECFIRDELGREPADGPPISLFGHTLSVTDMLRLYRTADAFVLPSHGEGFGRPYMEAMAAGLPVIGTRWGGHLDFMTDDNSYLIDCTLGEVPERMWRWAAGYRGHRWAEPSVAHLRSLMRRVFEERGEAAAKGVRAQREVGERFSWTRVAGIVAERLGVAPGGVPATPAPVRVTWEGPQFLHFGMAVVNREVCRALVGADDIALTLVTDPPAEADAPADARLESLVERRPRRPVDVHVQHEWPPRFVPPADGRWVMMQPWDFGALPRAWIEPMNRLLDEIWVPSHYVRSCFIRSGIDPRRVVVVPYGVDPARFNPDAPPRELPTGKTFRFLFVGGTLHRKGADILLEVYLRTFRREDDVCLVVKDLGTESFYRGQGLRDRLRALAADPRAPEIVYLEQDLPEEDLPGLYTACQCLVHPFRGEGFGLPIVEAMACGLPVIVPGCGPALEMCDPETANLVPVAEVRLREARVGDLETVEAPWLCEVDRTALALAMRRVVEHPEEARERGRRGSERVRRDFAWARAADLVRKRVRALLAQPIRRHAPPAPTRRQELSVCMIVRDEESRLPACLASVRDVADDIVVMDTGSSDRTPEIARACGARVFETPWTDDWAAARNASLAHAAGDWILVIDADQTLDAGSRGELRRLIQVEHDPPVGFLLRQLNYMDETGTASVVEHLTVRLFPNHPAIRYAGRIHEQVVSLVPELTLEHVPCGVVLHHDGYRSPASRQRKAERDLEILERLVAEAPDDSFAAFNLGMTYLILSRPRDAEDCFRRAIDRGTRPRSAGSPAYLLSARLVLATALLAQERPAEAAATCRELLGLAPEFADAWCGLGAAELRLGHYEAAADAFRRALGCAGMPRVTLTDRSTSGWKAWCGLGQAELLRGRWADALPCLERAQALNPHAAEVFRLLETALEEGLRQRPNEPRLDRARGRLLAARGDLDGALAHLQRALQNDDTDPVTLLATADVLLSLGAPAEAADAYRAALALRPDSVEARRGLRAARAASA